MSGGKLVIKIYIMTTGDVNVLSVTLSALGRENEISLPKDFSVKSEPRSILALSGKWKDIKNPFFLLT